MTDAASNEGVDYQHASVEPATDPAADPVDVPPAAVERRSSVERRAAERRLRETLDRIQRQFRATGLASQIESLVSGDVESFARDVTVLAADATGCERVNGLAVVLRGYLSMIGELAGDQWNEGDVSCSVVRRVALPDAFFAADGLFQTFLTVLDEFGAFPAVIQRELDRYLPFLATTKVLMAAVRNGVGRETAHEAIKEAAVGTALDMRRGQAENDVFARLAADERLGLTAGQLESLVADPITFTGAAVPQVEGVVRRVGEVAARHPEAAAYSPGAIL